MIIVYLCVLAVVPLLTGTDEQTHCFLRFQLERRKKRTKNDEKQQQRHLLLLLFLLFICMCVYLIPYVLLLLFIVSNFIIFRVLFRCK